jgi:hypothetical protein
MNELDEIIAWVHTHGPAPLMLDGWDRSSIWGWDEAVGSLYAHLWRNTNNPAKPPAIRIEPDDHTPAITLLPTLAQYIAMAANCDPWDAVTALLEVENQQEYRDSKDQNARADEADTAVTLTEGHNVWWPPDRATRAGISDQANRQYRADRRTIRTAGGRPG